MVSISSQKYVVSAPRSGLNWMRFCIERFYELRTPGKTLLWDKEHVKEAAFQRSHDALGFYRQPTNSADAQPVFVPEEKSGDKTLLILRDPVASYVRAYRKRHRSFRAYIGNMIFYARAAGDKRVVYYEDIVADPHAMWQALCFLDLPVPANHDKPILERLVSEWNAAGEASRGLYNINQSEGGGTQTKDNPTDFNFHQRKVSDKEKAFVWYLLEQELSNEELTLLARYRGNESLPPVQLYDRYRLRFGRIRDHFKS